jgi:hypothetical protein
MAKSPDELVALEDELRKLARTHHVGPLSIKERRPNEIDGSFDFLGYHLTEVDGTLVPGLGPKSEERLKNLRRQAYRLLHSGMPSKMKVKKVGRLLEQHENITNGLPLWRGRKAFHEIKTEKLRCDLASVVEGLDT